MELGKLTEDETVTPSHIKIKYKGDEDKIIIKPQIQENKNEDISKNQIKKKKVESIADTVSRLNKLSKKLAQESGRKLTDSDEELIGEVENYKDMLGKEVEMDENFKRKIEEFRRSIISNRKEGKDQDKAGLIVNNPNSNNDKKSDNSIFRENIFEEIVNNLSNPKFDINNYNLINNVFTKKIEAKSKKSEIEIDFSSGGLQTFRNEEDFTHRKRDREEGTKKYGVASRPADRNAQEQDEDDENDYDVIYTVGERMGEEHDLNVNRYENKFSDINEEF